MKIRKDDTVKVLVGKDRGKTGRVLMVIRDSGKVVVEGVNLVSRHVKPGKVSKKGGIIKVEKPLDISNVLPVCKKCQRAVRVGFSLAGGKKYRVCKKCGEVFEK